ncbi:ATP-dependent DNA ligase [Plantactinospora sp. CA-294935]|uniref:ATP-dependent DNA ligase n=1 Tax=Plantactinospora sp. CA-294935 TaxID=3240012 RepID=UPI003D940690
MLSWPLDPVRAVAARAMPESAGRSAFEMKWDGFRAIIWRTAGGVRIQSRQGADLTRLFPDLVSSLRATMPVRTVLDGELLVRDTQRGRSSFSLLQRRLTAGRRLPETIRRHPAHLVAFDLLRDGRGVELLDQPLIVRRTKLQRLLRNTPPQIAVCPQTTDRGVAVSWLRDLGVGGVEGVVIKPVASLYRPGARLWTKVRAHDTAEFVIGGVTGARDRPMTLLLGRFDDHGTLRFVGQTHPVKAEDRQELARALRAISFPEGPAPATRGRVPSRPDGRATSPNGNRWRSSPSSRPSLPRWRSTQRWTARSAASGTEAAWSGFVLISRRQTSPRAAPRLSATSPTPAAR